MRSFMIFGTVFFFFIASICFWDSYSSIAILREGTVIKAALVKKPNHYWPRRWGAPDGTCIFRYAGEEFRHDLSRDIVAEYHIGSTREFYHISRFPDDFLEKWETFDRQYWNIGCGVFFFLVGLLCLYRATIGIPRDEKRELGELTWPQPGRKGHKKVKHSHTVSKKGKNGGSGE